MTVQYHYPNVLMKSKFEFINGYVKEITVFKAIFLAMFTIIL